MDFKNEFYRITKMINIEDSFVFTRYGDGEIMLMNGEEISEQTQAFIVDKWCSNGNTKLGGKLNETLDHTEKNWFYGIPCQCCNDRCKNILLNKLKTENITYANLFVNSNYILFKEWVSKLECDVVVIGNHNGVNSDFPFKVKEYIELPDNCVSFYEKNHGEFEKDLINRVNKYEKTLFLISGGPLAQVIIESLWINNKNNKYVDVGSALDEFIHGKKTRPYMIEGTYHNINKCKF